MSGLRLERPFFNRSTLDVARHLLGARIIHLLDGQRVGGVIIETEAYMGEADLACHARSGRTARTVVMYGPPGHAYVYFVYGMHWLFNCVTEAEGSPAAVLLRAIVPTEGLGVVAAKRAGRPESQWASGPARLTQALGIDGSINNADLCAPDAPLWLETGDPIPNSTVTTSPRVGLTSVPEPWKSIPWRFTAHLS